MTTNWCILRTSSQNTVKLAGTLTEAGYATWTPTETRTERPGRSRNREEYEAPIMPTYVFADATRLGELIALTRSPSLVYRVWDSAARRHVEKGHPHFTVFREATRYPLVRDASLDALRFLERKAREAAERRREQAARNAEDAARRKRRTGPPPVFKVGSTLRLADGPFGGLDLKVTEQTGKLVKLEYPGWSNHLELTAWTLAEMGALTID